MTSLTIVQRKHRKGFTLLELLVATTVFLILAVLVSSVVDLTGTSYRREKNHVERETAARFALSRIQKDLDEKIVRPDFPLFSNVASAQVPGFYSRVLSSTGDRGVAAIVYRLRGTTLERGVQGTDFAGPNATRFLPASFPLLSNSDFQEVSRSAIGLGTIYLKKSDGMLTATLPAISDIASVTVGLALIDLESLGKLDNLQKNSLVGLFVTPDGALPLQSWWKALYEDSLPSDLPEWIRGQISMQQRTISTQ